jgi:hypothetical protein
MVASLRGGWNRGVCSPRLRGPANPTRTRAHQLWPDASAAASSSKRLPNRFIVAGSRSQAAEDLSPPQGWESQGENQPRRDRALLKCRGTNFDFLSRRVPIFRLVEATSASCRDRAHSDSFNRRCNLKKRSAARIHHIVELLASYVVVGQVKLGRLRQRPLSIHPPQMLQCPAQVAQARGTPYQSGAVAQAADDHGALQASPAWRPSTIPGNQRRQIP